MLYTTRLFGYIKICLIIIQKSYSTYTMCLLLMSIGMSALNIEIFYGVFLVTVCSRLQFPAVRRRLAAAAARIKLWPAGGECPSAVLCCRTWRHPLATSRQRCPAGWRWNTSRLRPRRTTGSTGRRPASHSTCSSWTDISRVKGLAHCPAHPSGEPWSKRTARAALRPASSSTPCCRPRTRVNGRPRLKGWFLFRFLIYFNLRITFTILFF